MRELPIELELEAEQLVSNCRHSVVLSVRDRRERTGATLRLTPMGAARLRDELGELRDEPGKDRRVFVIAADLEVTIR